MRSAFSSEVLYQPRNAPFVTLPGSLNCSVHRLKALSYKTFSLGCNLRYLRCNDAII